MAVIKSSPVTGKVVCTKAATCSEDCGAKKPHWPESCEHCPFDKSAKCTEYKGGD